MIKVEATPRNARAGDPKIDLATALLERHVVAEHSAAARELINGRRVLVTGAAGSIGSEISRQAVALGGDVYFLDTDESRLHALKLKLSGSGLLDDPSVVLADIRDAARVRQVFAEIRPEIVFHAAAHKHLPLLERYPSEGVKTNAQGTGNLVAAAIAFGADRFINVSTDKAADPTSVLGATKRIAESIVAAHAGTPTKLASVRFGNVLASRGSLIDTLRHQICNTGAVAVTDPDVERYFMTIPEAVSLVIEAAVMAESGETYVLDMGEPVKIVDIVHRFADYLGRQQPSVTFVGLRPGEKLSEDLFSDAEDRTPTTNPRVWMCAPSEPIARFDEMLIDLYRAAGEADDRLVANALPGLTSMLTAQPDPARQAVAV